MRAGELALSHNPTENYHSLVETRLVRQCPILHVKYFGQPSPPSQQRYHDGV